MPAGYDLVVIGGGAAGLGAARVGVAAGARTLLVSEGELGGECTFTGCVPSKTLIEAAARGAAFSAAMAETGYLTNETFFELSELPGRLAVLGGGAVGCELAQAFARLGSRVTLIEAALRLLPEADPAASEVVEEVFRAEGISVRTGVAAAAVRPDENGLSLVLTSGEETAADRLLVATGREAVAGHLDLETAGVRLDERGHVVTDRHLATTAPGIYAAGDVTGRMPFTHAAYTKSPPGGAAGERASASEGGRRPERPRTAPPHARLASLASPGQLSAGGLSAA